MHFTYFSRKSSSSWAFNLYVNISWGFGALSLLIFFPRGVYKRHETGKFYRGIITAIIIWIIQTPSSAKVWTITLLFPFGVHDFKRPSLQNANNGHVLCWRNYYYCCWRRKYDLCNWIFLYLLDAIDEFTDWFYACVL